MKSFKHYIVFFLVIGMAISCADENRAFKPKPVVGAFNANGKAAGNGQGGNGDDSKKTGGDNDKKTPDTVKAPVAAPQVAKNILADTAAQQMQMTNNNQPETKKAGDTTVKVAPSPQSGAAAGGKVQGQIDVVSLEKEASTFFANETRVKAEAKNIAQNILGVTVSRYPVAEQNKFYIEVLTLVKIGAERETIVSRGKLTIPGANSVGLPLYLTSTISKVDNEYSIDDMIKVKAFCEKDSNCDKITVIVTFLSETKKGEDKVIVPLFAGYLFELADGTQPDKYTKMLILTGIGATVGTEYKSYEDALATAQKPNFNDKGQPVVGGQAATPVAAGQHEKEAVAEAQRLKVGAEDDKSLRDERQDRTLVEDKAEAKVAAKAQLAVEKANNERIAEENRRLQLGRAEDKSLADERQDRTLVEAAAEKRVGHASELRLQQADIATAEAHEAQGVQQRSWLARQGDSISNSVSNTYNSSASTVRHWIAAVDNKVESYVKARDEYIDAKVQSVKDWWNGPEKKVETAKVDDKKAGEKKDDKKVEATKVEVKKVEAVNLTGKPTILPPK